MPAVSAGFATCIPGGTYNYSSIVVQVYPETLNPKLLILCCAQGTNHPVAWDIADGCEEFPVGTVVFPPKMVML